jgi:hypothetical protein
MLEVMQRATRLHLSPRAGPAVLDGGWWPRSWDPVSELPGLVLALSEKHGRIRQLLVNGDSWQGRRFSRLAVGDDVVRMGWFTSQNPAVLIAVTARGQQIDLLVVPPAAPDEVAASAMDAAADPADTRHAPAILSAAFDEHLHPMRRVG